MKAAPLALACVLLGATALVPASFAQTPSGGAGSEASPSTASPDASSKTGTQAQADWRDEDGRSGGTSRKSWRSAQDDDRFSSSGDRGGRYADEDDEDDDDMMGSSRGPSRFGNRMGGGSDDDGMRRMGRMGGMDSMRGMRMDPETMRMHMRMMHGHHGGAARGARLKLKRGDSAIDIRCPSGETISACVDAVGKLMDRLHDMPQTSGGTAPQTPAPATPNR